MNRFRDWIERRAHIGMMLDVYRRRGLIMEGKFLRAAPWYMVAEKSHYLNKYGRLPTSEDATGDRKGIFLVSQLLGGGPKIYRPTAEETEALEHVELRLPVSDYEQPFETFAVEFPAAYASKRKIPEVSGPGESDPYLAIAHRAASWLLVGVFMEGNIVDIIGVDLTDSGRSMEATLDNNVAEGAHAKNLKRLLRVTLNSCLLLTNYGCVRVGYDDPKGVKKLKERANRNDAQAEWHRHLLAATPVVYRVDQHIKLFRERRYVRRDGDGESGRQVGPHWRNGHWCWQPHGPGNTLRKKIMRPGLFVNPHLFFGQMSDTNVTMTTGGAGRGPDGSPGPTPGQGGEAAADRGQV